MDIPDIDGDMMEDALVRFRDKAKRMSQNKSNGTFEKIKNKIAFKSDVKKMTVV